MPDSQIGTHVMCTTPLIIGRNRHVRNIPVVVGNFSIDFSVYGELINRGTQDLCGARWLRTPCNCRSTL